MKTLRLSFVTDIEDYLYFLATVVILSNIVSYFKCTVNNDIRQNGHKLSLLTFKYIFANQKKFIEFPHIWLIIPAIKTSNVDKDNCTSLWRVFNESVCRCSAVIASRTVVASKYQAKSQ